MTREQAKELLPIIQAFAEGKTIQVKSSDGLWYGREGENCEFNFNADPQVYRIKSEPKYRPFANAEECWQEMQKHRPFGWLCNKINNQHYYITALDDYGVVTTPFDEIKYTKYTDIIKRETTFVDGAPFGIKE
jgi:hypothetical protein